MYHPSRKRAPPNIRPTGNNNRPVEDITSPSRTRLRTVKSKNRNNNDNSSEIYDRGSGPHGSRHLQPDPRHQAGGDTRGWSHNLKQQYQPLDRRYLREHPPKNGSWPSSQDQGRGMHAGGDQQHSQYPPVPDTRHKVYGGNSNQHRASGGYNGLTHPMEGQRGSRWISDEGSISSLPPPPQGDFVSGSQDYGWGDERGMGEKRGSWGTNGPSLARGFEAATSRISDRGSNTWQGGQSVAVNSRTNVDGGWRKTDGGGYPRVHRDGQPWEHGGPPEYRHLGPEVPPGGAPAVGVGVGAGVVCTKASTMHNPVDPEELARIQAKKNAYRRDLETQVIEAASAKAENRRVASSGAKLISFRNYAVNFLPH